MFITIGRFYTDQSLLQQQARIKTNAWRRLSWFKLSAKDIAIEQYLQLKYGIDLKAACRILIMRCSIQTTLDRSELTVFFPTKELDNLASIITYGNANLYGSSILNYIFYEG